MMSGECSTSRESAMNGVELDATKRSLRQYNDTGKTIARSVHNMHNSIHNNESA